MGRVLLVDDEPGVLFTLREVLRDSGHDTVTATSAAEALERLDGVESVLTDLSMPGMDGLSLIRALRERDETLPVILLTAHGSDRVAVAAIKAGAYDYLTKPFDVDEVALVIGRALEARRLRQSNLRLSAEQSIGRRIVGESESMKRLLEATARVARRDITVLVRGETGTGKELIAALLHAQSPRAGKPLVRFNCAAIPGELAEAELFGHARGAFTGAQQARPGFFAQAHGGTLVLDEVGEFPLSLQPKLLRAIQEGEIQPVGSGRIDKVDVRLVAATHRDLLSEARAGRFREDLYYRLAVVELEVPPLRERRQDIPALCDEFARRYADKFGIDDLRLSPELKQALGAAEWPGNVRQLENTIARLAALSNGGLLELPALGGPFAGMAAEASGGPGGASGPGADEAHDGEAAGGEALSLREQVEAFERNLIARALTASRGNHSEAARRLGTSRATLIDKIKKYRLSGSASESSG